MKKIFALVCLIFSITSVCAASPLPDCSLGEIALSVNLGAPDLATGSATSSGKDSFGYDVTAGLGFGFAGHYSYNDFRAKTSLNGSSEVKAQQLVLANNLWDLVGNISVFGGVSQTQVAGSSRHNGLVAGLAGNVPLGFNTKAYAVVTAGEHEGGYEAGLSYELARDTEFNLGYRRTKFKDLTFNNGSTDDVTVKGLVGGVSFKF